MGEVNPSLVNNPKVELGRGSAVSPEITLFIWFSGIDVGIALIFNIRWILIFIFAYFIFLAFRFDSYLKDPKKTWMMFTEKTAFDMFDRVIHSLGSKEAPLIASEVQEGELATQPVTQSKKISAKAGIVKVKPK